MRRRFSTIFEAASLSKPLFAYFVMKMVEEGVLNLAEPYYPFLESIMPENIYEMVDANEALILQRTV